MIRECPSCKEEYLDYDCDTKCGEAEFWGCGSCDKVFIVPIDTVRDWLYRGRRAETAEVSS